LRKSPFICSLKLKFDVEITLGRVQITLKREEIAIERVKITLCVLKSHSCVLKSHSSVCSEKLSVSAKTYLKIDTHACEFHMQTCYFYTFACRFDYCVLILEVWDKSEVLKRFQKQFLKLNSKLKKRRIF
jgi:hypothetical protein